MDYQKIIDMAKIAQKNAYSPYFKFKVGACVLTKSGNTYIGCNVENVAGCGVCAERVAVSNAIANGDKDIVAIAVVGDNKKDFTYPCGVCRQFIAEFGKDINVVLYKEPNEIKVEKISKLLPNTFDSLK